MEKKAQLGLEALGETLTAGQPLAPGMVLFPFFTSCSPTLGPARTIDFKSIVSFEVTGSHFAHHRKHIQEVVQGHVAIPILGEDLGDPLAEWVVLEIRSREAIPGQGPRGSIWSHSWHPTSWELPSTPTKTPSLPWSLDRTSDIATLCPCGLGDVDPTSSCRGSHMTRVRPIRDFHSPGNRDWL